MKPAPIASPPDSLRRLLRLGLWALALAACAGRAQEFELEGTFSFRDGNESVERAFRVAFADSNWVVEAWPSEPAGNPPVVWAAASRTPGEVYKVTRVSTNTPPIGIIESNSAPVDLNGFIPHIWLMCASSRYWDGRVPGRAKPVYDPGAGVWFDRARELPACWVLADAAPFLPLEVTFFESERPGEGTPASDNAPAPDTPCATALRTNAHFRTVLVTNLGGLQLPLLFSFERFAGGAVCQSAVGRVTAARLGCDTDSYLAPLETTMVVEDRRLMHVGPPTRPVNYTLTRRDWPGLGELRRILQQDTLGDWKLSTGAVVLLGLILGAPLLLAVVRSRHAPPKPSAARTHEGSHERG